MVTEDYTSHICDSIHHIVSTYATFHSLDCMQTKATIIKHLTNTLCDQVAVNHCVVQRLQENLETELLELKCNIHPLDGIAKKSSNVLHIYDLNNNITSETFGRECCAVNFIINKMRYKQCKGDPAGFTFFATK